MHRTARLWVFKVWPQTQALKPRTPKKAFQILPEFRTNPDECTKPKPLYQHPYLHKPLSPATPLEATTYPIIGILPS